MSVCSRPAAAPPPNTISAGPAAGRERVSGSGGLRVWGSEGLGSEGSEGLGVWGSEGLGVGHVDVLIQATSQSCCRHCWLIFSQGHKQEGC